MNFIRQFINDKAEILRGIDPECIEVENVRVLIGGPRFLAEMVCEAAVRNGDFEKWIDLRNPYSKRVITSYRENSTPLPSPITDEHAALWGDDETEFELDELESRTVYKLKG